MEAMAWLPDWPLAAKPAAAATTTWLARRRKPAGDRINPHPHERQYNKGSTHGAARPTQASKPTRPAGRRSSCPAPATTTGERSPVKTASRPPVYEDRASNRAPIITAPNTGPSSDSSACASSVKHIESAGYTRASGSFEASGTSHVGSVPVMERDSGRDGSGFDCVVVRRSGGTNELTKRTTGMGVTLAGVWWLRWVHSALSEPS